MKALNLFFVKTLSWLKLQILKILVWRLSILFPRSKCLKKVLIIKPDHLGDLLICLSAFQGLCDYYHAKGYEISLLVSSLNKPIADACPIIDNVLAYNIQRKDFSLRQQYAMYRFLYKSRFSVVINPACFPGFCLKSHTISIICRADYCCTVINSKMIPMSLSPAEHYLYIDRWRNYYSLFHEDDSSSVMKTEHKLAELVCGQELPMSLYSRGFGVMPSIATPKEYYIIVPGAASRTPWSMENLAQLIVKIHGKCPNLIPLLTGGPNEKPLGMQIRRAVPADMSIVDRIGETTLLELFALIQKAKFVITNDTGTAHVAPLFSVPSFVISGAWHPGVYLPNPLYDHSHCIMHPMDCSNCGWTKCKHMVRGNTKCITEISVTEVFAVIESHMLLLKDASTVSQQSECPV